MTAEVSRGEFSMLVQQMYTSITALNKRMDDHEQDHKDAEQARRVARRWLIGTVIAALAVIEVPLLYLVAHVT